MALPSAVVKSTVTPAAPPVRFTLISATPTFSATV
jgi:hypothetical protein